MRTAELLGIAEGPDIAKAVVNVALEAAQRQPSTDQLAIVKCAVLDWMGVTVVGSDSDVAVALSESLTLGEGSRTDSGQLPHLTARALATAGHVLDYDDVLPSVGHPTNTILPALIAVSRWDTISGASLINAFIGAFEAEARIGQLLGPDHYAAGFHSTATIGVFGAALSSALVRGASADELLACLSLSSLSSSGLKSAFGGWGKSLQVGHAVSEGVLADRLVKEGARVDSESFGGAQGFLSTHRGASDDRLIDASSESALRELLFKYHASCFGTHSAIEGVLRLIKPEAVNSVTMVDLYISTKHVGMCDRRDASTVLEAKFSLPFAVATAIRFRAVDLSTLNVDNLSSQATKSLAAKINLRVEPERDFAMTRVVVTFDDGSTAEIEVDTARPAQGAEVWQLQWPRLVEKFYSLTARALSKSDADVVVALVEDLENLETIDGLSEVLMDRLITSQRKYEERNV